MDPIEVKVRLLELAAETYGGVGSVHYDAEGIAKIARDWYNNIESWKKSDTAPIAGTISLPRKAPLK